MALTVTEAQEKALRQLDLRAQRSGVENPQQSLQDLIDAEYARRGVPDATTGAFHALALNQGELLKNEYDLTTHAHHAAWELGAVLVDPVRTIALNMRYGFKVGDAVLRAVVGGLKTVMPRAKVVRIHTDGFAALLPPSSEMELVPELRQRVLDALPAAVAAVLPEDGEPKPVVEFTVSLLKLRIRGPSHWHVLGPLVWAECERALAHEKRTGARELQERTVLLDAAIPTGR